MWKYHFKKISIGLAVMFIVMASGCAGLKIAENKRIPLVPGETTNGRISEYGYNLDYTLDYTGGYTGGKAGEGNRVRLTGRLQPFWDVAQLTVWINFLDNSGNRLSSTVIYSQRSGKRHARADRSLSRMIDVPKGTESVAFTYVYEQRRERR